MKQLLLISTFLFGLLQAQIVNIPDSTFKYVLLNNPAINTNIDNEIQLSEAQGFIDTLEISSMGILDLTGIEAFTNITGLNCSFNSLDSINLNSCHNLRYLNFSSCECSFINLNNCDSLLYINSSVNPINNLDIADKTKLKILDCRINLFSTLDVSNNTPLEYLRCFSYNLNNLNLTNNQNLKYLNINSNQINSLNLSNNNKLNYLYLTNLPIDSLNLQYNDSLVYIDLSSMPLSNILLPLNCEVETLKYSGIHLDSINLNSLDSLKQIDIRNMPLLTKFVYTNQNSVNSTKLSSRYNENLICIEVLNTNYSNQNWYKDGWTSFNTNCENYYCNSYSIVDSFTTYCPIITENNETITEGEYWEIIDIQNNIQGCDSILYKYNYVAFIDIPSDPFIEIFQVDSSLYVKWCLELNNEILCDTIDNVYYHVTWYFNNQALPDTTEFLIPNQSGLYSVSAYVLDTCFMETDEIFFTLNNPVDTTGLNYFHKLSIKVHPNPANNSIYIQSENTHNLSVEIMDVNGRKCLVKELRNENFIDIHQLDNGLYIIKIRDLQTKQENILKFIKQ